MKSIKQTPWITLGPALLFSASLLLSVKTEIFSRHPVWFFAFLFAAALAFVITLCTLYEMKSQEHRLTQEVEKSSEERQALQINLQQTQAFYRQKAQKLEEEITAMEEEHGKLYKEKDYNFTQLKSGYEELFEESKSSKNRAKAFQIALEDALNELRHLQQYQFLQELKQSDTPKDLMQKYLQLRAQFEEKSLILNQTRQRLFAIEGEFGSYVLKQKEKEESKEIQLLQHLSELSEENIYLEEEVKQLEELLTSSIKGEKSKAKGKLKELLELQFDL